jgi:raffinose/stachyose/melibiose transport system permease protein
VPSYVMMANLGLIDTSLPVVLLWAATSVPGNVFLLSSLMRSIPSEVLEAARIDGAGYVETLLRIVLPLSVPGIVTVMIFNITAWWNDLLIPLVFIGQEANTTVTAAAATLGSRFSMDYPLVLTGLLLASLPPLAAYIVLQRYIRRGLVLGAVK